MGNLIISVKEVCKIEACSFSFKGFKQFKVVYFQLKESSPPHHIVIPSLEMQLPYDARTRFLRTR